MPAGDRRCPGAVGSCEGWCTNPRTVSPPGSGLCLAIQPLTVSDCWGSRRRLASVSTAGVLGGVIPAAAKLVKVTWEILWPGRGRGCCAPVELCAEMRSPHVTHIRRYILEPTGLRWRPGSPEGSGGDRGHRQENRVDRLDDPTANIRDRLTDPYPGAGADRLARNPAHRRSV